MSLLNLLRVYFANGGQSNTNSLEHKDYVSYETEESCSRLSEQALAQFLCGSLLSPPPLVDFFLTLVSLVVTRWLPGDLRLQECPFHGGWWGENGEGEQDKSLLTIVKDACTLLWWDPPICFPWHVPFPRNCNLSESRVHVLLMLLQVSFIDVQFTRGKMHSFLFDEFGFDVHI